MLLSVGKKGGIGIALLKLTNDIMRGFRML